MMTGANFGRWRNGRKNGRITGKFPTWMNYPSSAIRGFSGFINDSQRIKTPGNTDWHNAFKAPLSSDFPILPLNNLDNGGNEKSFYREDALFPPEPPEPLLPLH